MKIRFLFHLDTEDCGSVSPGDERETELGQLHIERGNAVPVVAEKPKEKEGGDKK